MAIAVALVAAHDRSGKNSGIVCGAYLKSGIVQMIKQNHCMRLKALTNLRYPHAMNLKRFAAIAFCMTLFACSSMSASNSNESARSQVWAAESAFARTMADRDLSRFSDYLAEEAVFFTGTTALRGKSEIIEGWARFFAGPDAPFSWEPDQVEVLSSGGLALSTGPVRDPTGNVIGRFNSIWRLEASGQWRVVFDKGSPPSPGPGHP